MTRRLIALIALSLLVVACGDDSTTATTTPVVPSPLVGTLHISGGLEGTDELWQLAGNGSVTGPNNETGRISDADLTAINDALVFAGFFGLDAQYMPEDTCCDRFTYTISITDGEQSNTVTTIDAADAPDSLFALIDTFRAALRSAITP
ncbi:MAG: protealysin inhibitor emfourin [Actinomycetota bacterium]